MANTGFVGFNWTVSPITSLGFSGLNFGHVNYLIIKLIDQSGTLPSLAGITVNIDDGITVESYITNSDGYAYVPDRDFNTATLSIAGGEIIAEATYDSLVQTNQYIEVILNKSLIVVTENKNLTFVKNAEITVNNVINLVTDVNGETCIYSTTGTTLNFVITKNSEFIGDALFTYEDLITSILYNNQPQLDFVLNLTILQNNFQLNVVDKSYQFLRRIPLVISFNSIVDRNIDSGSDGIVGPLVVAPDINTNVKVVFKGDSEYQAKTEIFLKESIDDFTTSFFVLQAIPDNKKLATEILSVIDNLNLYNINGLNYGLITQSISECIKESICKLRQYVDQLNVLDITNSSDLKLFNNICTEVQKILNKVELKDIKNIDYFKYPLTGLVSSFIDESSIKIEWQYSKFSDITYIVERSTDNINFTEIATLPFYTREYTDQFLTANTIYYYRVSVIRNGEIVDTETKGYRTKHILPENFTGISGNTIIDLSWNDSNLEETGFDIDISTDNNIFSDLIELPIDTVTYQATGLEEGQQYFFLLRYLDSVNSNQSNFISYRGVTLISAPTSLGLNVLGTSIELSWTNNSPSTVQFEIDQSLDGVNFTNIATTSDTNFTVTGLDEETPYFFRVRAITQFNQSAYSTIETATTEIAAPTNLSLSVVGNTQIDLSWADNSNIEDNYEVEISTDGINFNQIVVLGPNTTTYSSIGLNPSTMYFYRVRSSNALYDSPYSTIESACTTLNNITID